MDDYRRELAGVKKELTEVEAQLEQLLERQNQLSDQKQELEAILWQHTEKANVEQDKKWESTDFSWSKELAEKMQSVFKIDELRTMQLQPMNVSLSGKDCILIMPTGGGKSLCFQLPALVSKGITLVVSPLVSLMEDQLMALEDLGVDAAKLSASSTKEEVKRIQDAMIDKKSALKLLYVTPEKLAKSKRFMNRLEKMYQVGRFCRLVIDEVHCCSQWGHDFRPDYKFLGIMKRQFPEVPILGLTATATVRVLEDVKKILNIPNCYLFRASFNRSNLYYEVRPKPSSLTETMDEIQKLIQTRFQAQSGIVYCFSRKDTEEVARELQKRGIKAGCYHADLLAKERSRIHRMWTTSQMQVVVATVAFGMGIDKPDVRFVIHHSLSKSMENLYQESGRAGRDDKISHCIVYYRLADVFRQSTMVFTEQTGLDNLYGIVAYCIDASRCRRSVIACHFGEVWESSQCNEMCDHCDSSVKRPVNQRDVTRLSQNVLKILDQAGSTDQRLTAIKLVDAWYGKGQASLKVKGMDTLSGVTRDKAEKIVAHLLLEGYIKEDFHFTPYSTISYLVPGPRAAFVRNGTSKISMEFESKIKPQALADSSKINSSSPLKGSNSTHTNDKNSVSLQKQSSDTSKPELFVINHENSVLSSCVGKVVVGGGESPKARSSGLVKKRKAVIDSDSELDDLAFEEDTPPTKKASFSKSNFLKTTKPNGVHSGKPILIDDSSDSDSP